MTTDSEFFLLTYVYQARDAVPGINGSNDLTSTPSQPHQLRVEPLTISGHIPNLVTRAIGYHAS